MKIKKSGEIPLDKFIDLSLYNKKIGYYMKKILLVKRVILLQRQIFQDFFQK